MFPFSLFMSVLSLLTFFGGFLLTTEAVFELIVISQVWGAVGLLSLEKK